MIEVVLYTFISFIKVLVKNCKTIFLIQGNKTYTILLAGANALLAANLFKMIITLDIVIVSIITFSVNVIGAYISIIISKQKQI